MIALEISILRLSICKLNSSAGGKYASMKLYPISSPRRCNTRPIFCLVTGYPILEKESDIRVLQASTNGNHWMHRNECKARWINSKVSQWLLLGRVVS